jgi:hypothetical protein
MIDPKDTGTATVAYVFRDEDDRVAVDLIAWADSDPEWTDFGPQGTPGSGRVRRILFGLPEDVESVEAAGLGMALSLGIFPQVCQDYDTYLTRFADALAEAGHSGAIRPLSTTDLTVYDTGTNSPVSRLDVETLWGVSDADALGLEALADA